MSDTTESDLLQRLQVEGYPYPTDWLVGALPEAVIWNLASTGVDLSEIHSSSDLLNVYNQTLSSLVHHAHGFVEVAEQASWGGMSSTNRKIVRCLTRGVVLSSALAALEGNRPTLRLIPGSDDGYLSALNEAPEARGLVPVRDAFPEEIVDQGYDLDEDHEIITAPIGLGMNHEIDPTYLDSGALIAEVRGVAEPEAEPERETQ